jgi:hypothetical protein
MTIRSSDQGQQYRGRERVSPENPKSGDLFREHHELLLNRVQESTSSPISSQKGGSIRGTDWIGRVTGDGMGKETAVYIQQCCGRLTDVVR